HWTVEELRDRQSVVLAAQATAAAAVTA
ncbi:MAG: hypothetical protein JWR16_1925, partial [Nevskia sp.]|nr:hypothetical protein [Nevskia sp.]